MNDEITVVFDIGGTKTRVAVATGPGKLEEPTVVPTPQDPNEGIDTLANIARTVANDRPIGHISGCLPCEIYEGRLFNATNLPQWNGLHFAEKLEAALGAGVSVANDTSVIGVGEAQVGAGKGSSIMAYVTVSTGVGAGRIVGGAIDRSTFGFHMGQQKVNGEALENLVSGTAVRKKYGIEPKDFADENGRNELADILAVGLFNTTVHWSPDTIVLGGSMIIGVNPVPLERTREALAKLMDGYPVVPIIKMAELGDFGGLHGASVLVNAAPKAVQTASV